VPNVQECARVLGGVILPLKIYDAVEKISKWGGNQTVGTFVSGAESSPEVTRNLPPWIN